MTYSEFQTLIKDLHTGAPLPSSIADITKLVLGKIARLRLQSNLKIHEITTGGNTEWVLKTEIPGFIAFKLSEENKNRCIYYYQSTEPYFLTLTNPTRFAQNTEGGYATKVDGKLKIDFPGGITSPDTLYVPYYSKYLVLDEDGSTEKEKPENDDDTFLIDSIFDDALVDGVLLYVKRKELDNQEFIKASQEWNKALMSLAFYE